jgi:hypothetical protein
MLALVTVKVSPTVKTGAVDHGERAGLAADRVPRLVKPLTASRARAAFQSSSVIGATGGGAGFLGRRLVGYGGFYRSPFRSGLGGS